MSPHDEHPWMTTSLPPELTVLTREQVAEILQVHPTSISKMAGNGRLRSFRTGPGEGGIRFTLADVSEYVQQQRELGLALSRKLPANPHQRRAPSVPVSLEPWDE